MLRPLQMAHAFLLEVITKEDIVVDATMGNGHDTLFLARLAKKVYLLIFKSKPLSKPPSAWQKLNWTMLNCF